MSDGLTLPVRCVNCESDLEVAMSERRHGSEGYVYVVVVEPCRVCMEERTKKHEKDASDLAALRKLRDTLKALGSILQVDDETISRSIVELTWLESHGASLHSLFHEAVRRGLLRL